MAEKGRKIGRYSIREYTARRLVAESSGASPAALGTLWGVFFLVALLIQPWRGGTRLPIVITVGIVVAAISLLVLYFVPRREQLTVDLETGTCGIERTYLPPGKTQRIQVPLTAVAEVRCRRLLWQDAPRIQAVRWVIELTGKDEETWRLAEGIEEGPMQELSRLIAEVAGRPFSGMTPERVTEADR